MGKRFKTTEEAFAHTHGAERDVYGWIQWKGTNVCMDIHCKCGAHCHIDAWHAYHVRCGRCGTDYFCNPNIELIEVDHPDSEPIEAPDEGQAEVYQKMLEKLSMPFDMESPWKERAEKLERELAYLLDRANFSAPGQWKEYAEDLKGLLDDPNVEWERNDYGGETCRWCGTNRGVLTPPPHAPDCEYAILMGRPRREG